MTILELVYAARKHADRVWVWLGGSHLIDPTTIGDGEHDCALADIWKYTSCR